MKVNHGSIGCLSCMYKEYDDIFGYVCQHKASMEGIEAKKNFYKIHEVTECDFYDYNEESALYR